MPRESYQTAKFMIVDDEIANIRVLEHLLDAWDCPNVQSTTDPTQALALYSQFQPDIVLLDLMMARLDGFGVMQQLQTVIPEHDYLPILVLTADVTPEIKHRALALGAKDFVTKPFDIAELSLRIQNLLETRFLHRQLQNQNAILEGRVEERTYQLKIAEIETIECLALAGEYRDDDTGQHAQRVGITAARLALHIGMSPPEAELIQRAAPLHDVGKIGIGDHILLKPARLTMEEFDAMKAHCAIGHQILSRHHTPLLQRAADIAHCHHERWDGSGYPQGLRGEDIPIEGRLVAIADVFDALTHERPYKKAWPLEEAATEIQNQSGRQFDPRLAETFGSHLESICDFSLYPES